MGNEEPNASNFFRKKFINYIKLDTDYEYGIISIKP